MKTTKLILAFAFLISGGALAAPLVASDETQADCKNIYSEYRNESGVCHGPTTRLCEECTVVEAT